MRSDGSSESYERLFVRFSAPVERWIIRAFIFLAVLLLIVQTALCNSSLRRLVTKVDRLEGSPVVQKISDSYDSSFAYKD